MTSSQHLSSSAATSQEEHAHHSTYKGFEIVKVTQANGRVTYDTKRPDGSADTWDNESLAVAKAQISAEVG